MSDQGAIGTDSGAKVDPTWRPRLSELTIPFASTVLIVLAAHFWVPETWLVAVRTGVLLWIALVVGLGFSRRRGARRR